MKTLSLLLTAFLVACAPVKPDLKYKPQHVELFATHMVRVLACIERSNAESVVTMHKEHGFRAATDHVEMLMSTVDPNTGGAVCGLLVADVANEKVLRHEMLQFPDGMKDVYVVTLTSPDGELTIYAIVVVPDDVSKARELPEDTGLTPVRAIPIPSWKYHATPNPSVRI